MPTDAPAQPTRVHVAGPVETEARNGRRHRVQRCLRCDLILWLAGGRLGDRAEFPIGELVAWIETDETIVLTDLARPRMRPDEIRCDAP